MPMKWLKSRTPVLKWDEFPCDVRSPEEIHEPVSRAGATGGRARFPGIPEADVRLQCAAKRAKLPLLPEDNMIIDVESIFRAMNTEVLKEAKTKDSANVTRFQRNVQSNIDEGTPLLWSVQLGKFPERGIPQRGGGHMRLIIGYNTKTNEIIFTDSSGAATR